MAMKLFSTRLHATLDYLLGGLLIISPWLLGFAGDHISTWVPVAAGAFVILYSLFTDYEYGFVPEISARNHLILDGIVGIILAISPWLFNFEEIVFLPHLILGLVFMVASVSTDTIPTIIRKRKPV